MKGSLIRMLDSDEIDEHGPGYWRTVLRGVKELMDHRDRIQDKDVLKKIFLDSKHEILQAPILPIHEDLLDEWEAILINWYPMKDFWTSTFEQFCSFPGFREYRP